MMKFTLAWLKEHLDTDRALGEIADKLTMIGLEVERIEDMGKQLAPFTIARVVEAKQHPNADRLRVCMVDTGTGDPVQVVCGAPNARTGMKGVFVPPGAYIPGKDMTLAVGTIRGVESRGMLVSEFELKISDNHEGIIELPDDAPVGASYAQLCRPRRSGDRDQSDAEPAGLHRRARHRPRSRRRRHGQVQGCGHQAGQGRVPLPGRGADRGAGAVPRVRAAPRARRQERAVAGLAAKAADRDRLAPDQCAGRYHQFHHLRPRPAAARVRRRESARQSHGAPGERRRTTAGARRQDLHARRQRLRHRRRRRRRIARPASWAAKQPAARKPPPTC